MKNGRILFGLSLALLVALSFAVPRDAAAIVFHTDCYPYTFDVDVIGVFPDGTVEGAGTLDNNAGEITAVRLFYSKNWNELAIINASTAWF